MLFPLRSLQCVTKIETALIRPGNLQCLQLWIPRKRAFAKEDNLIRGQVPERKVLSTVLHSRSVNYYYYTCVAYKR